MRNKSIQNTNIETNTKVQWRLNQEQPEVTLSGVQLHQTNILLLVASL